MFFATQGGCWVYFALHHGLLLPSECIPPHKCLPLYHYITFQPIVAHPGCSPCWSLRCLPQTIHTKKACSWVVLHRHSRQPKGPLQDVSTASAPQANRVGEVSGIRAWTSEPALPNQNIVQPPQLHQGPPLTSKIGVKIGDVFRHTRRVLGILCTAPRLLPPSGCIPLHKCLPLYHYITFQPIVAHPGCSPCWSLRCLPQTIHTKKACFWVVLHRHSRQPKGPLQDVSTASVPQGNGVGEVSGFRAWTPEPALPNQNILQPRQLH